MDRAAGLNIAFIGRKPKGQKAEQVINAEKDDLGDAADIDLLKAEVGKTYIIRKIDTDDVEMNAFLFRLGCYSGENITVVSKKKNSCVVVIKDGRYSLDKMLSKAIIV